MAFAVFVSVNKSFEPSMSIQELEHHAARAWSLRVASAEKADRVIAVFEGEPVAAWKLRGAYPTNETYKVNTGELRPRIALDLGEPLPVLPAYNPAPALRRGVAVAEIAISADREDAG